MNRDVRFDQMQDLNNPYMDYSPKSSSSKYRSFEESYGNVQPSMPQLPPHLANVSPPMRAAPNTRKFVHQNMITRPQQRQRAFPPQPTVTPIESLEEFNEHPPVSVEAPPEEEIKETFSPSGDHVNCKDLLDHVNNCPLCQNYYKNDVLPYIIIIFILVVILIVLLKKVLSG